MLNPCQLMSNHSLISHVNRLDSSVPFVRFAMLYNMENKPKDYPQQRETKTVAKHAMNEVCLLPRPFYSRGRACKLQSRHKHCI